MERDRLDSMTVDQLRRLAERNNIHTTADTHSALIDAIMAHLEQNVPTAEVGGSGATSVQSVVHSQNVASEKSKSVHKALVSSKPSTSSTEQMMEIMNRCLQQQELIFEQLRAITARNNGTPDDSSVRSNAPTVEQISVPSPQQEITHVAVLNSLPPANAVSILTRQIPEFGGSDEENVLVKLTKSVKRWYDLQTGKALESWSSLKQELIKMFYRKISFTSAMQKIEARRWNCVKESFDQYAIDKLVMVHRLNLPQSDIINLLIGGIMKSSLRATALTLNTDTVEEFLEKMRLITTGISDLEKKETAPRKTQQPVNKKTKNQHKEQSGGSAKQDTQSLCFYCKKPGHRIGECYKLKRKNELTGGSSSSSSPTGTSAPKQLTTAAVAQSTQENTAAVVLSTFSDCLQISKSVIHVTSLDNNNCSLKALVDTGSPITLIPLKTFNKFINVSLDSLEKVNRTFTSASNDTLDIKDNQNVFDNQREIVRDMAVRANEKLREYNRLYYNERHKKPTKYKEGDYVLIRQLQNKPGVNAKFASKYKGPYIIAKVLNNNRFVVKDIPGFNITAKPYDTILSSDKLKPWVKPLIPESTDN
ncbi:hypothetical protein ALC62_01072 [Cyphomyrmex costatus]|uniref:CCHC-type domain-containing protein n=1 Tax=Cyphomyrmex costatus TaxID=456900 RepID=A0A151IPM8_9HYME|nr:hypothetical protein ALC62_01072 [Cyphomyrmex costatus]